jgi:hypothetical protein
VFILYFSSTSMNWSEDRFMRVTNIFLPIMMMSRHKVLQTTTNGPIDLHDAKTFEGLLVFDAVYIDPLITAC